LETQSQKPPQALVFPADVRAGQVIGIVEVVGGLGSKIDISKLAEELGLNLAVLLPTLDAAEMLGLTRIEKGDVSLTDFGLKFQKQTKNKVLMLKHILTKIEPFKTAVELANRRGGFTAEELSSILTDKGIRWSNMDELNNSILSSMLIHWAIYAGLLNYDGREQKFSKPQTPQPRV
jgi:NitT/TauT family transport system ATP-binding protein